MTERAGQAPVLSLPPGMSVSFSLSHSGDWAACAVGQGRTLGLDIELLDPARDVAALAAVTFSAEALRWLDRQPPNRRVSAFYHLWSLHEALYKMQATSPCMIDAAGTLVAEGADWHSYPLPHADLSVVLCTDRPLLNNPHMVHVSVADLAQSVSTLP